METVPEKPESIEALRDCVREAADRKTPLVVEGNASKRGLGHPSTGRPVSLANLRGIIDYDPDEMVITALAGTPLDDIEQALRTRGQVLGFEPCAMEGLWPATARPTIGGTVAAAIAGPRRFALGGPRDHLLGFKAVDGRGEVFRAGGRVVKNVTGYDLPKLAAGSFGTLFLMTELTLRVFPQPQATRVLCVDGLSDAAGLACLRTLALSPLEPTALAHVPARAGAPARTFCRFEGESDGVRDRAAAAAASLGMAATHLEGDEARALVDRLVHVADAFEPHTAVWRVSVPATAAPALLGDTKPTRFLADAAGGVLWLQDPVPETHACAQAQGGHALLCRRADGTTRPEAVFQPPDTPTLSLLARLKDAFDPARILNPGRMYREL